MNSINNKIHIINPIYHLISLNMLTKKINKECRLIKIMFSIMVVLNSKVNNILNNLPIKALEVVV
jgi:hypothetical protein